MFHFGKEKNKEKEKVLPRDTSSDRVPRPFTGIRIVERQSPPPAPSSHVDSVEPVRPLDIVDVETQLSEELSDASSSNRGYKTYVQPNGNLGFIPSKPAAAAVTKVLRHKYTDAWLTWGEVPYATRQMLFNEFQVDVWWDPEHMEQMWKTFNSRCSKRLSSMLSEVRATGERPNWIPEAVWIELLRKWSIEEYKSKYEKAKTSREFDQGACLHSSGCISISTIAKKW